MMREPNYSQYKSPKQANTSSAALIQKPACSRSPKSGQTEKTLVIECHMYGDIRKLKVEPEHGIILKCDEFSLVAHPVERISEAST